jgi:predicted CopG family antitoxin
MSSTTITISSQAYERLKELKNPGESFSDVILENINPPARTCGELLDQLENIKGTFVDKELMAQVRAGRGRRSNRKTRNAR